MSDYIIYEQPVAENVRNFLKCEYLNEKLNSSLLQDNIWSIKSSIITLLEMSDFSQRINLKIEFLKELEKSNLLIKKLYNDEILDISKYDKYKTQIEKCLLELENLDGNPSKKILDNDFLMQIKSKLHIPAGDNFFDMPSYLNFLSSKKNFIVENINKWSQPFSPFFQSSKLILSIKRRSSKFEPFISNNSFFEKKLENDQKFDLVRIRLEKNTNIYPDISVNRQNINAVFKTSYGDSRLSKPVIEDVRFELSLSILV